MALVYERMCPQQISYCFLSCYKNIGTSLGQLIYLIATNSLSLTRNVPMISVLVRRGKREKSIGKMRNKRKKGRRCTYPDKGVNHSLPPQTYKDKINHTVCVLIELCFTMLFNIVKCPLHISVSPKSYQNIKQKQTKKIIVHIRSYKQWKSDIHHFHRVGERKW